MLCRIFLASVSVLILETFLIVLFTVFLSVTCEEQVQRTVMSSSSADYIPPTVTEGRATVYLPPSVFYNPVQEFNRDLTIAVITEHVHDFCSPAKQEAWKWKRSQFVTDGTTSESNPSDHKPVSNCDLQVTAENKTNKVETADKGNGVRILEGLAASGLRSVRFALEVPFVREVVANDFDSTAVEYIRRNAVHNNVDRLITASCNDAAMCMYLSRRLIWTHMALRPHFSILLFNVSPRVAYCV